MSSDNAPRPAVQTSPLIISESSAVILEAVRREGDVARSGLPETTLLSQQSVHRLCEDLLGKGLLELRPPKIEGRGKPSPRVALHAQGGFGLGIAIDSDRLSVSLADLSGALLHHQTIAADPRDPETAIPAALEALQVLRADHALPSSRIAGIGVSMQGFRNRDAPKTFATSTPLNAWASIDVEAAFGARSDLPVLAENNATLGAVAELWAGAGRKAASFVYLSINYGFGGGIVLNGAPYFGHFGNAAEISSVYSEQEFADRPALSSLLEMLQQDGVDVSTVGDLANRYDNDWPAIAAWVDRVTPSTNSMLRILQGIIDPEAIVFGGEAPEELRRRLKENASLVQTDRTGRPVPVPKLLLSHIDGDPSALGAALLPIRRAWFEPPAES